MNTELELLRAEIGTLEQFLAELSDDDVIERHQLGHRLRMAQERLNSWSNRAPRKLLPITFRGRPVDGTRSIEASFGADAIRAFVEATDTVAASLTTTLADRGKLPNSGHRTLRIVDTALGSFGFQLELEPLDPAHQLELDAQADDVEDDPYERAIDITLNLIDEAASQDEDAISDLVAEIHPRAAAKVRSFAKLLAEHEAFFAAQFGDRRVELKDEDQVNRVVRALEEADITENRETAEGTILGVLPEARTFEVRLVSGMVIRGKIERGIKDISAFKQAWENTLALLEFRVIRVRKTSRYLLVGASETSS